MKSKFIVLFPLFTLCLSGCNSQYVPNDYDKFKDLPTYSPLIESVDYTAMVTGVNAPTNTKEKWLIGGTDLGLPYYDNQSGKMFYLFGDTFPEASKASGGDLWRSNVLGYSKDFNLSNGLSFDGFITDPQKGYAKYIIPSEHNPNGTGGERTAIPTGGISINGTQYVFYMSITEWLSVGWDVNFCGCYKSTDGGENFTQVKNLYWSGSTKQKRTYTAYKYDIGYDKTENHINDNFMQIFPYQVEDYVYIIGIPGGRFGGAKLGRVKIEDFENFDKYEYYTGKNSEGEQIWLEGSEGLKALTDNSSSYIVEPQVGEPGLSYSTYFGKHMLSYYSNNKIIFRLSDNMVDWSDSVTIATSEEFNQLYGGFTHQKFEEKQGKIQYFLVSQYYVQDLGENQYNVKLLKVTFK